MDVRRLRHLGVAPLWLVLGLLLALLLAVAAYKVWPILHPPLTHVAVADPDCDLRSGPCWARFPDGGSISFGIQPSDIPIVTPLTLSVRARGLEVGAVEVDFAGVDMDMGFNRVRLSQRQAGDYQGQGMLPVCVRDRMIWEARVLIHSAAGIRAASYRFETRR